MCRRPISRAKCSSGDLRRRIRRGGVLRRRGRRGGVLRRDGPRVRQRRRRDGPGELQRRTRWGAPSELKRRRWGGAAGGWLRRRRPSGAGGLRGASPVLLPRPLTTALAASHGDGGRLGIDSGGSSSGRSKTVGENRGKNL